MDFESKIISREISELLWEKEKTLANLHKIILILHQLDKKVETTT